MAEPKSRELDQDSLETLFPAVAAALDAVAQERRLTVMTKAFFLLAHRTGALDEALAALAEAPDDPRDGADRQP